ncbi:MAG: quinol:cytochrome C oxidoreductase, partial [Chitinophagaceae bacterium]|nr:quinol:cytochrome C oxidoreductase [Chitinophagaceae bacterium]
MAAIKTQFEIPSSMKGWAFGLMGVGLVLIIVGFFTKGTSADDHERAIYWATLLYNAIYFLLMVNSSMFLICATTLAMGAWQMAFRRVAEAISAMVPVLGTITGVLLIGLVFTHQHNIYHWLSEDAAKDPELSKKLGFLNPGFFTAWTVLTIGLWWLLGARMRKLSSETDDARFDNETGARFIWRNTVTAALFIVWFGLTVGSVTPWFWMMSIDAHWYSTMYSWYNFASSFVAGMALLALFFIYLKNKGYLELANQEHLHDIGKFMFAFSIFWTYLWFSQYMLIWYANIPEETIYFMHRVKGAYKGIFFLNLIINFVCPILILMTRSSKRSYTIMTFMAVLIIFGHWLDYYQMVMGSVSKEHVTLG